MKKIFFLLMLLLKCSFSNATHIEGADLTYRSLSNDTLEFTFKFYRDCVGILPSNSYNIYIRSTNCNIYDSCVVMQLGTEIEVSPLCPNYISQSSCNGGSLPGVQEYIFTGKKYLPQLCDDYVFSWEECCRNAAITNIVTPGLVGIRMEATWNKTATGMNNSAAFNTLPVFYTCVNQPMNWFCGGYDSDGDSLVYNFIQPRSNTANTDSFVYLSPWSFTYPLTTQSGSLNLDNSTGEISMTPSGMPLEISCLALKIDEYRNGNLIASVMRDIQMVILNCDNSAPTVAGNLINNLVGGIQTSSNTIELCAGTQASFDVIVHDINGDNVFATSNINSVLSGGTVLLNTILPDSVHAHFNINTNGMNAGIYNFNLILNENACPIFGQNAYNYTIKILQQTDAGLNTAICQPANSIQLNAVGGTVFSWLPTVGLNASNISNPIASPSVTTTYHVYSNNAAVTCSNDDSVIVAVNTPIILNTNLSQDSACFGQSVQLLSSVSGGAGSGYIYSWTNGAGNLVSTIANPLLFPIASGVYHLTVSNGNCMATDDVIYTMVPIPVNNVSTTPLNGCIPLTVTTTNNSINAISYFWNAGNGNTYTAEAPAIVYNSCCTYTITYISTGLAGCTDTTIISPVLTDFPYPPATIIYEFGHLTATDFALYIWYFNGVEIPGNNGPHQPCDSAGFYQVLTSWNGVCYMLSDSFYFDCGQGTGIGIENTKPDNLFSIYPNPTSKEITVNYNLYTSGAFSIYNLLGEKVEEIILEKNTTKKNISLTNIPSGIYFCVIKTEDGKMYKQKLVVQR